MRIESWSLDLLDGHWRRDFEPFSFRKNDKPEIFNTDQGSQFTSQLYVKLLKKEEVQISKEGKGRYTR